MKIRKSEFHDIKQIKEIIGALHPEWFDNNALINIPIDASINPTYVVEKEDKVVGFIVLSAKNGEVTISWIGVEKTQHRKGIGSLLIEKAVQEAKNVNAKCIVVETVGECEPIDIPYQNTVSFYLSKGFKPYKQGEEKEDNGYKYRMVLFKKELNE